MKFEKKLRLSESLDDILNFENKAIGTAPVVFQDAVENMKKAREIAEDRLKEQNKAVEKPVDGTAKGGETTIKKNPEAKKLHLSEALFDDSAFEDSLDDDDEDEKDYDEWYDMYAFIMDSFTETGTDYKKYKIPKAVAKELAVACTASDAAEDVSAINNFPIGVDNNDNIVVHCSNENILNAYIKCAEDYKLSYKVVDNKKPGQYNNFTIKVAVPKDSIGQIYCVGDYFRDKGIPLNSVLGYMDNKMKSSFAVYLAKNGELFANPDDNEAYVKENAPVRTRRRKEEPVSELEQEVATADATETSEEPLEEAKQKLSDKLRAALAKKEFLSEDVSARPNSDRLLSMIDDSVIDTAKLAEELIAWLPDDEVGEFATTYEYFPEQPVEEDEEVLEEAVNGKKVSFTLDGKEYKGTCVGDSSTNPDMCDVRIGKEYYDNEENINLRKGIYNPHEDREIKDGKFFIPKSELKEEFEDEDDSLVIISDISSYTPWEGAVGTYDLIKEAGKIESLTALIKEMYPEGITKYSLNDLLWFERDWVLDMLQINVDGDIHTEEE